MHLDLYLNPLPVPVLFAVTGVLFVTAIYFIWARHAQKQSVQ
jgi:hypothetical protein